MRKPTVCFSLVLLLLAAPALPQNLKLSPEQQQVWNQEEKYWESVKAQDRAGYIALWDEDFVGWPYRFAEPIRKDQIRADPFGMLQGRRLQSVQLQPKAVQVFKDVAIVHYRVTNVYKLSDGNLQTQAARITHTWRRNNGVWLIIGGMSALVQEPKPQ
jgi:ketosteroid isomerase-like protein